MSTIECVVFRMFSARVNLWKFLIFEKVLPSVSRAFLRGRFFTRTFIRSWFLWCTGPKSLAPGESSPRWKGLGVQQNTHLFGCCVRPQRLLISTTAHVNDTHFVQLLCTATETPNINYSSCERTHTLVRLLCTATETPNINYSSCERTHTRSAAVYGTETS